MMVLLLRPTGPSDAPERKDWNVVDDGAVIGHICEDLASPELRWFWSIFESHPGPRRLAKTGRAPTLDEAKAQFRASWERFKSYGQ
jgi:hypothetical protein